jgi:hypothetical protein
MTRIPLPSPNGTNKAGLFLTINNGTHAIVSDAKPARDNTASRNWAPHQEDCFGKGDANNSIDARDEEVTGGPPLYGRNFEMM